MVTLASRQTVGPAVLEFYETLPFNIMGSVDSEVALIREEDLAGAYYPVLPEYLRAGARVLEVGCGTGWLSNAMALHHAAEVTGLDFNPVAVSRARQMAGALGVSTTFVVSDLFAFEAPEPFDVVVSNGVLHHTGDCIGALRHVFNDLLKPGGVALIGLYHAYGRAPFLGHFDQMRAAGATEEQMLDRYAQLHPNLNDRVHLTSWFRDQVCHPHETQHTLAEMLPLLDETGMVLVSASINRFEPFATAQELTDAEPALEQIGQERLALNQYYPGFFLFLARKAGAPG